MTDRGHPAYVLLTIETYQKITKKKESIIDLIAMPDVADIHFDTAIAQCCAKLHVPNPQSDRNAIIAATALIHGMTIVTRNISDFEATGVEIINPWNHKE